MVRTWAKDRPYLFSIGLFVVSLILPLPLVVAFRVLGLQLEPLRLILPAVESAFALWVIWHLGWFRSSGFTGTVRNIGVYWFPLLLAFVPLLLYGSIALPAHSIVFWTAALFFTGLSEESLARALILRAVLPKGKWAALLFASVLFSVGHFTNLFFEDFSAIEMIDKLLATFAFAILYGAVYLRTFNIWPLIILHMIHDYAFLTSGTAGPFVSEPMSIPISMALAVAAIAYGVIVAAKADVAAFLAEPEKAAT